MSGDFAVVSASLWLLGYSVVLLTIFAGSLRRRYFTSTSGGKLLTWDHLALSDAVEFVTSEYSAACFSFLVVDLIERALWFVGLR